MQLTKTSPHNKLPRPGIQLPHSLLDAPQRRALVPGLHQRLPASRKVLQRVPHVRAPHSAHGEALLHWPRFWGRGAAGGG